MSEGSALDGALRGVANGRLAVGALARLSPKLTSRPSATSDVVDGGGSFSPEGVRITPQRHRHERWLRG